MSANHFPRAKSHIYRVPPYEGEPSAKQTAEKTAAEIQQAINRAIASLDPRGWES